MRSTDLTDKRKEAVLDSLRHGATITAAAKAAGITRHAVYWWMHHDPEFAELAKAAREEMVQVIWGEVYRMAVTEHYDEIEYDADDNQKKRIPKTRWPNLGACDMILRNWGDHYVQRLHPQDGATGVDLAKEIAQSIKDITAPDTPEPEELEKTEDEADD